MPSVRPCSLCGEPTTNKKFCSSSCSGASRALRRNYPEPAPVDGAAWIPVGHGKHVLMDIEDHEMVSNFSWTLNGKGYAVATYREDKKQRHLRLHRLIMGAKKDVQVDHVNGDRSDNRKSNLRLASHAQNLFNRGGHRRNGKKSSKYKGVYLDRSRGRWAAGIGVDGKYLGLGRFNTQREAARAYDEAARKHHGKFARLNFPEESERGC